MGYWQATIYWDGMEMRLPELFHRSLFHAVIKKLEVGVAWKRGYIFSIGSVRPSIRYWTSI